MRVKVHIKNQSDDTRLTFATNPETIQTTASTNFKSYQLMSGSIKIPNGREPKAITLKGIFLGTDDPADIKEQLDLWQEHKAKLNMKVTGIRIHEEVALSSYTCTDKGAHGDVEYTLKFESYGTIKIQTTEELNLSAYAPVNAREGKGNPPGASYQVVSGDNLWKIARKHYGGNGSDWTLIYEANKEAIEAEAKKHGKSSSDNGHWIYPGTVFTIPAKAV